MLLTAVSETNIGRRSSSLIVISSEELSEGTDNFTNSKCIGEGGFGRVFLCDPLDGMCITALLGFGMHDISRCA